MSTEAEPMPEGMTEKHLQYLDDLRAKGTTNMFGASTFLEKHFYIDHGIALRYLLYWMHTFSTRHPAGWTLT